MVFWLQIFADKNTYNTREFAIIQIILANIIALVADTNIVQEGYLIEIPK